MFVRPYSYAWHSDGVDRLFEIASADIDGGVTIHNVTTKECLTMPSLRVYNSDKDFQQQLITNYLNAKTVPQEILRTFQGAKSEWKLIRCYMRNLERIIFNLVHPERYLKAKADNSDLNEGHNIETDLKIGLFTVMIETDKSFDFEIETVRMNPVSGKLDATARFSFNCLGKHRLEYIERYSYLSRRNRVGLDGDINHAEVHVVENYYC